MSHRVIPVKTGIQWTIVLLDTHFRGYDLVVLYP